MRTSILSIIAVLAFSLAPAWADHHVTTVVDGLDNPAGIAIQPETGHVFVSDSGASRIIRVVDGKAQAVITDFPVDVYGKGPMYNIGPLGLEKVQVWPTGTKTRHSWRTRSAGAFGTSRPSS